MIYFNSEFLKDDIISNYRAYNYGVGCFETIMLHGKKGIFFKEHIERLEKAMKYLNIYREIDYKKIISELINFDAVEENEEASLKIVVTDRDISIVAKNILFRDEPEGIMVKLERELYQNEFGFIKSISYAHNILAFEKFKREGYYEGIFTNRNGSVTEGSISNLFFIKNGVIYTPSLSLNILPGITREKIIRIIKKLALPFYEGEYRIEELLNADSIFITNSLMKNGNLWVKEIDGKTKKKSEIIDIISDEYQREKESSFVEFH